MRLVFAANSAHAGAAARRRSAAGPATRRTAVAGFIYGLGYALTDVSLSGVVTERTTDEQTPIEGVRVYCDACGATGHTWRFTDKNGPTRFTGISPAAAACGWRRVTLRPYSCRKRASSS
jgi:hypothetical protein